MAPAFQNVLRYVAVGLCVAAVTFAATATFILAVPASVGLVSANDDPREDEQDPSCVPSQIVDAEYVRRSDVEGASEDAPNARGDRLPESTLQAVRAVDLYPDGSRRLGECQPFMAEPRTRAALLDFLHSSSDDRESRQHVLYAFAACARSPDDLFFLAHTVRNPEPLRSNYLIASIHVLEAVGRTPPEGVDRRQWLSGLRADFASTIEHLGADPALASNVRAISIEAITSSQ